MTTSPIWCVESHVPRTLTDELLAKRRWTAMMFGEHRPRPTFQRGRATTWLCHLQQRTWAQFRNLGARDHWSGLDMRLGNTSEHSQTFNGV